ncbi:hypothetical protein EDD53_1342 [Pacificibacter maritimus]|uniref:Uncharacterized protein n=1 Tax=Pacificibacter maritimus TaxID=762213 RepID=A0A3N4UP50_9RHOB|nr:hypothetical protein [Pacificibacter maritimus]RPE72193.1 hypothetical protein EDD53_1342 [Pacificibacter maritimus]
MPYVNAFYPFKIRGEYPRVFIAKIQSDVVAAADSKGFTVLCRGGPDRQMYILGCRTCGTPIHRRDRVVFDHKILCEGCGNKKDEVAAAALGGELVSPKPMGHRHLRQWRLKCGHLAIGQRGNMRKAARGNNNASCKECLKEQHAAEAADHGWTLIGPAARNNQSYREYEHLCGHRQDVSVANMRHGDVNCAGCSETWSSKPSKIYLLTFSLPTLPVIKLGYSNNPKFRLRQVQFDPDKTRGTLDRAIDIKSGHRAICLEKAMHQYIQTHRPDLIVERDLFRDHLTTTSEIYHAHGRTFISALIDAADNGWDPNLTGDWQTFTSLRDT